MSVDEDQKHPVLDRCGAQAEGSRTFTCTLKRGHAERIHCDENTGATWPAGYVLEGWTCQCCGYGGGSTRSVRACPRCLHVLGIAPTAATIADALESWSIAGPLEGLIKRAIRELRRAAVER